MNKISIGAREVDEETFRKFRALAIEQKLKLGEALTEAMKNLMKEKGERMEKKQSNAQILLDSEPIRVGKKVRWSEEIDEILYGLKK